MANKILQAYIDEAKRDAASISTGWSSTLLAYVWELEDHLREAREALAGTEINLANYNDDDVAALNDAMVKAYVILTDALVAHEVKGVEAIQEVSPRVCGNCKHGSPTSLEDTRCYKATPYLPTGRHCRACTDWEPCDWHKNPRTEAEAHP